MQEECSRCLFAEKGIYFWVLATKDRKNCLLMSKFSFFPQDHQKSFYLLVCGVGGLKHTQHFGSMMKCFYLSGLDHLFTGRIQNLHLNRMSKEL